MTEEQKLNREALEAMGWKHPDRDKGAFDAHFRDGLLINPSSSRRHGGIEHPLLWLKPGGKRYEDLAEAPNLRTDLNAMADAEEWLEKELGNFYLFRGHENGCKTGALGTVLVSMAYWALLRTPQNADNDDFELIEETASTECLARLKAWIAVWRWWKATRVEEK